MTADPSPLLKLPAPVRLRIYDYAGILNGDDAPVYHRMEMRFRLYTSTRYHDGTRKARFIDLNGKQHDWEDGTDVHATRALLLTCRLFYNEVSAVVYGSNHFYLICKDPQSLDGLWRLRSCSVQALRHLTIHLTPNTCGSPLCDRVQGPWRGQSFDPLTMRFEDRSKEPPLCLSDTAAQVCSGPQVYTVERS